MEQNVAQTVPRVSITGIFDNKENTFMMITIKNSNLNFFEIEEYLLNSFMKTPRFYFLRIFKTPMRIRISPMI